MKIDKQFLSDVTRAARIEYNHFSKTPRPITWQAAIEYAVEHVRQERRLAAVYAEIAA